MIKLQKIDTILFDLDGTLIDSNELIIKSFEFTLNKYMPNRFFSRNDFIDMIGPPLKETFRIAGDDPNLILHMIEDYRRFYIEHEFDYIDIYPEVLDTLKTLSNRGFNLGVVTTKFKSSAMPSMMHYGIDEYIKAYCFLDDIREHKPHPEPIFFALKQFGQYQKVIMVGDNTSDILAGRNASTLTCGVAWSLKKSMIQALKPDFWIDHFHQLIDLIDQYNKEE